MTVDLPPHVTAPESLAWTYWATLDDAAAALGSPVARLLAGEPAIGSPVHEGAAPLHMWVRYQDDDGRMFGVVTLPWPPDLTAEATSAVAAARAVAAMLRDPGEPAPDDAPAGTRSSIAVDAAWYPATTVRVDSTTFARAVVLPKGWTAVIWAFEEELLNRVWREGTTYRGQRPNEP